MQKKIVCVVGPPSCGKGTVIKELMGAGVLRAVALGSGDTLRALPKDSTEWARVAPYMQQGRFVPDELLLPLMIPAILAAGPIVFLDGMPRTMEQLIALRGLDETNLQFIWLQASHKICLDRALGRNREDDAESTLRERLAAYRLQTIPTLTAAASGSCVIRVDVSGSREKAFRAFLRAVMAIFPEDKKDIQELLQSLKV